MVAVRDRALRVAESREKILKPFELDETLCLYSPQDNIDSLHHPRIAAWNDFIDHHYQPSLPDGRRRIMLFVPCTKTKPYPFSLEHLHINRALLSAGFSPSAALYPPETLIRELPDSFPPAAVNLSPLTDADGTVLHRFVISEPLACVPYEHIISYNGVASPACAYDDPGLFENRGNAVSPWRADFSATAISPTKWRWGLEERRAYVTMHNAMADRLAAVILRLARLYDRRFAWVAPGLTHRSFVVGKQERRANNIPVSRRVGNATMPLVGANDRLPQDLKIACLPTPAQCQEAQRRLALRLGRDVAHVGGYYSRGGGGATPLALPELLDILLAAISAGAAAGQCGESCARSSIGSPAT
jgi:hypothetical protein